MVNMNVPYRGPDGLSKTLLAELQARYGARAQNKGFVTGYMDAARRGEQGGHFADNFGITHAVDIGVDIEMDGSGLLPKDALWVAEYLRKLGGARKHLFGQQGYLIHDMSTTTTPAPRIAGAYNGWKWDYYGGASPHSDHIHITTAGDNQWGEPSRLPRSLYDSTATWGLRPGAVVTPPAPVGGMRPAPEMYLQTQSYKQDLTQFNSGTVHGAVDIGVPPGTPLVAPMDGVVVFDGWAWDLPGGPNDYHLRLYLVKPNPGEIKKGAGIVTWIRTAHDVAYDWYICHANQSFYNRGDRIRKGTHIQDSGNTGWSTGPHSHIGLLPKNPNWLNGAYGHIDPAPFIRERYAPLTPVSWQGGSTGGVGGTVVTPKTFLEEIMALDRNSAEYKAFVNDVAEAAAHKTLTKRIELVGHSPEGKPYTGTISLGQALGWDNFRGFRDRRIEANTAKALDVLKALTTVVLAESDPENNTSNNTEGA